MFLSPKKKKKVFVLASLVPTKVPTLVMFLRLFASGIQGVPLFLLFFGNFISELF